MKKWIAIKKDGNTISETETNWENIKTETKSLQLINNEQIISLPENIDKFIQGKTASATFGSKNINIESRYIGFVFGNIEFKIRVDEKTNNISVEATKI